MKLRRGSVQRARGSGSGARGARGAERRESDTRAGVRVRALRGSRGAARVGGGRRRVGVGWRRGGGEDDRVRLSGSGMFGPSLSCKRKAKCPLFSLLRCRVGD